MTTNHDYFSIITKSGLYLFVLFTWLGGRVRYHVPVRGDVITHLESMVMREPESGLDPREERLFRRIVNLRGHEYPAKSASEAFTMYCDIVSHVSWQSFWISVLLLKTWCWLIKWNNMFIYVAFFSSQSTQAYTISCYTVYQL